ncbi:TIR domain-containing protein [Pseudomonas protegens]|uniref:TIR domain-containing protein n=1 Tax=Pseudomonas protegens TaxID=380021 RepID=UPI0034D3E79A
MLKRFENDQAELIEQLLVQPLVKHDTARATFLAEYGGLTAFDSSEELITLGEQTTDVFFLLTGSVRISIGKHVLVDSFEAGNYVGELAAVYVTSRTSTVTAREEVVALRLSREHFKAFLQEFSAASHAFALDLAKRMAIRNANVAKPREKHRIFAISSAEALRVVQSGIQHFTHDSDLEYAPWSMPQIFQLSSYPMDDLEEEMIRADFAVVIANDDDIVTSRNLEQSMPRDNVLFELGLFVGRFGRKRTVLMAPQGVNVKLPSDLKGLSIIYYPKDMRDTQENQVWDQVKRHFRKLL